MYLAQRARGRLIPLSRYGVSGGDGNEGKGSGGAAVDSLGQHCEVPTPVLKVVKSRKKH